MLPFFRVAKFPLSLLIGFSAFFGGCLAPAPFTMTAVMGLSVFLLAAGGAALNNIQDREIDGTMARTRIRPLPKGEIGIPGALSLAVTCIGAGMAMLVNYSVSLSAPGLGMVALILYNGIYTTLKRHTTLAILPGAICGALPPIIGYIGCGGAPLSFISWLLGALIFVWQIPHFWFVVLGNQHDYQHSAIPNMLQNLPEQSLRRLAITWIGSLVTIMLLFTILPIHALARYFIFFNVFLFLGLFVIGISGKNAINYRRIFVLFNVMLTLHMGIIIFGRLYG